MAFSIIFSADHTYAGGISMKRKDFLKFIAYRKKAIGCAVLGFSLLLGSLAYHPEPEFPVFVDPIMEVSLEAEDTPLADTPTSKTSVKKKVSKKVVKLKQKAKANETKNLGTTKKESTKSKKSGSTTIEIKTIVETQTQEIYKKGKKTKTVVKTVTTTTITTVLKGSGSDSGSSSSGDSGQTAAPTATPVPAPTTAPSNPSSSDGGGSSSTTPDPGSSSGSTPAPSSSEPKTLTEAELRSAAPKMNSNVLDAFIKLGFEVIINPSVSYSGYFDARNQTLTLKSMDTIGTIYHELGHFIAFAAGNIDKSSSFVGVYSSEKGAFPGTYKAYASQNASEYFAECMREHILNPAGLASACPNTSSTLATAISKINDTQITYLQRIYGGYWKKK